MCRKGYVGATIRSRVNIYLYNRRLYFEFLWVKDIEDSELVVIGRIWKLIRLYAGLLINQHHIIQCLSERMITILLKLLINLYPCDVLVSGFKRNHYQRDRTFEFQNILKCAGIKKDVELSCWSDISFLNSSAHQYDFFDLTLDLWEIKQQQAKVSQAACISPHNLVLILHNFLLNMIKTVFCYCCLGRIFEKDSTKPVLSMDMASEFHLPTNKIVRASVDLHICSANMIKNVQGIFSCIFEG